jgi:hypothetical protein
MILLVTGQNTRWKRMVNRIKRTLQDAIKLKIFVPIPRPTEIPKTAPRVTFPPSSKSVVMKCENNRNMGSCVLWRYDWPTIIKRKPSSRNKPKDIETKPP